MALGPIFMIIVALGAGFKFDDFSYLLLGTPRSCDIRDYKTGHFEVQAWILLIFG